MKKKTERVLQLVGKTVPVDYFLYSCLERERLTKHNRSALVASGHTEATGLEPGFEHWPPVAHPKSVGGSHTTFPEELQGKDLSALMVELCRWYAMRHPELTRGNTLTYEIIPDIVPAFVIFTHDLATLVYLKTDQQLPPRKSDDASAKEIWSTLTATLEKHFPAYASYFLEYLAWAFAAEVVEEWELGSRPPVGKYAPPLRLRQGTRDGRGGPPRGERGERSDNSGPPGRKQGGRDRPPRNDNHDQGKRHDRSDQPRGRARFDGPPRRGPAGGSGKSGPPKSPELEASAMSEVDAAIAQLRNNPDLQEVLLKPANSFYRRMQHQHAVDLGFNSNSVGEGPDRAVKVTR